MAVTFASPPFVWSSGLRSCPHLPWEPSPPKKCARSLVCSPHWKYVTYRGTASRSSNAPYVAYLNRICQSAVQNRLKTPDDCLHAEMARQVNDDAKHCLEMPPAAFDATVVRGQAAREVFLTEMKAQGINGVALIQAERTESP